MALYDEFEPEPNRLIHAKSAYLLHAAYQPVGWYEFCAEAFEEARREDKPILLDIGAAWCHWCHVIDRESYDNHDIATMINERFIPIKVDRDERPDIDTRYQAALQLLTGQGGWPLTVFLTPDGETFFGGTYFPPEDRDGHVGMKTVLTRVADAYAHHRAELMATARGLAERTAQAATSGVEPGTVSEAQFARIADSTRKRFNAEHGGFERTGPKFPHSSAIELALLQWDRTGDEAWLTIVVHTLKAMAHGGIMDQLGGGFHRYSVDASWTVPHFEKMSYDNALLLENYVHAYRATGEVVFQKIADTTIDFLLHEFTDHQRGGFYGSQDADNSLDDDGDYWTWTVQEVLDAVSPEEAAALIAHYGITQHGNMHGAGRNVLRIVKSPEQMAQELEAPVEAVLWRINTGKQKLLAARRARREPAIDTHKYANWNALLISACLEAGTLLGREDATHAGLHAASALLNGAYHPDKGIYHAFHTDVGARLPGFFEDQVYAARALLDAFAVSGEVRYYEAVRRVIDLCIERYWDADGGGFVDVDQSLDESGTASIMLHQARKVIEDMPTPAPNALAALVLDRLWVLTGDARYHDYAGKILEAFAAHAPDYGPFAATYGLALYYHLHPPLAVMIIGDPKGLDTRAMHQTALETYRPGRMVALFNQSSERLPYPASAFGRPIAYVCAGQTCAEPTSDVEALKARIKLFGKSEG